MKLWVYFLPLLHLVLPFILLYEIMRSDGYSMYRLHEFALFLQSISAVILLIVNYTGFLLVQNTKRPTLWAVLIFIGTIFLPWIVFALFMLVPTLLIH